MYEAKHQALLSPTALVRRLLVGPVDPPHTWGGKLFAGMYALYAGLVFILSAAILFTPVLHRVIQHFHLDPKGTGR